MPSLKHNLRFLFHGEVIFRFREIHFLIFQTILSTSKVVTSGWLLAYEVEYIFKYIFWTVNHLVMKIGQLKDIVTGNNFRTHIKWFGGLTLKSMPSLIYQPTAKNSKTTFDDFLFFYFFEDVRHESTKNDKHHLLKHFRTHQIIVLSKS